MILIELINDYRKWKGVRRILLFITFLDVKKKAFDRVNRKVLYIKLWDDAGVCDKFWKVLTNLLENTDTLFYKARKA